MVFLAYIQIIGVIAGLGLIVYARRYRTQDYPTFLKRNVFAIVSIGELRKHFIGHGFVIHKGGVILLTIGIFAGAVYLVERWWTV